MKSHKTVDEYILNVAKGSEILILLREIINSTELTETVKWSSPVYSINNKNVIGMAAFKSYVGLWFYNGSFLNDKAGVLINASEGVTKGLRQWHFTSLDEIDVKLVLEYINEAIKNQKLGKEIKPDRNKPLIIPEELYEAFDENPTLKNCFNKFTTGKKREFAEYVSSAKQPETRNAHVQKIIPMILDNIGLNDKYKK